MSRIRSLLFVPADSESKLTKARQQPADALVLDWEDAVLPVNKPLARQLTIDFFDSLPASHPVILIRLNPPSSTDFEEDFLALNKIAPDGLLLSKCQSADEVSQLVYRLDVMAHATRVQLYPQIESPLALLHAFKIANCSARVAGLAFGAEDFSTEMEIKRTAGEPELLYARSALVACCRAAAREVIDSPCLEWSDPEKTRLKARAARNLGFSGMLAIHPDQVPILNEIFSPTPEEVERARRVLKALSSSGAAVTVVDGQMVDEAIARRARRILEQLERS